MRFRLRYLPDLIRLFLNHSKVSLNRSMAYRTDFFTGLLIDLVFTSIGPIVQYLIFTQTQGYPGWNTEQILLFQGVLLLAMGLNNTLMGDVKSTAITIMHNGNFDRYLIKPYPAIGLLLAGGFTMKHIGTLISGIAITSYMLFHMRLLPGIQEILLFLWFIVAGVITYMGITIIFCGLVIILIQMGRLDSILENIMRFAGYPIELYNVVFKTFFIIVMPLAVLAYFPTQALLHRFDLNMLLVSLGVLLIFGFSLWFWNRCIRKYTSAGG